MAQKSQDTRWNAAPKGTLATGIGSLPHHNVDSALEYSFKLPIPFLPQIPIRHPEEYMIAQALYGLPGLVVENGGLVSLDINEWSRGTKRLAEQLERAFAREGTDADAFAEFEPTEAHYSCWSPFLWEASERGYKMLKTQLAGPLSCQWAMRLQDGSTIDTRTEVRTQIFRLVLARSIAMIRKLKGDGVQPIHYLDEPGLYGLQVANPTHTLGLQELKLVIQTLKKEGAIVGLHCCSNTDWRAVLGLGLDVVSLDTNLSLARVLEHPGDVDAFVTAGGRFSFGVIPTGSEPEELRRAEAGELFSRFVEILDRGWTGPQESRDRILRQAIYTPACGLALHSPADAEAVLATLLRVLERSQPRQL